MYSIILWLRRGPDFQKELLITQIWDSEAVSGVLEEAEEGATNYQIWDTKGVSGLLEEAEEEREGGIFNDSHFQY